MKKEKQSINKEKYYVRQIDNIFDAIDKKENKSLPCLILFKIYNISMFIVIFTCGYLYVRISILDDKIRYD